MPQCHMVLLGYLNIIYNESKKVQVTYALSLIKQLIEVAIGPL
jgi:hypothetical protein